MAKVMRASGAVVATLALTAVMAGATSAGAAPAGESDGRSDGAAEASSDAGEESELESLLEPLAELWDSTVSGGQAGSDRSSVGDYVDYALGTVAGAWNELVERWPEIKASLAELPGKLGDMLREAYEGVPENVSAALQEARDEATDHLQGVVTMRVTDCASGDVLYETRDQAKMAKAFTSLHFSQWVSVDAAQPARAAGNAGIRVAFLGSWASEDEAADGETRAASSSADADAASSASGESDDAYEQIAFVTYPDSDIVSVSILGSDALASYEVPQADVDLLNGLTG